MNPDSPENQAKRRDWADKNIYACVSPLISYLMKQSIAVEEPWYDDLFSASFEGECTEPITFYAVSDFLAYELKKRGCAVAKNMYGLNVWGRETFGQLCYLDSVMEDIWVTFND